MAVVHYDRDVFASEKEGDNDVGANVAEATSHKDFLRRISRCQVSQRHGEHTLRSEEAMVDRGAELRWRSKVSAV